MIDKDQKAYSNYMDTYINF